MDSHHHFDGLGSGSYPVTTGHSHLGQACTGSPVFGGSAVLCVAPEQAYGK